MVFLMSSPEEKIRLKIRKRKSEAIYSTMVIVGREVSAL